MNIGKILYGSRENGQSTQDPRVRNYLRKKYRDRCVYCGRKYNPKKAKNYPLLYFSRIEIDHIIPFSRGGRNHISNYTFSCKECNRRKGIKIYRNP